MTLLDWLIVIIPMCALLGVAFYAKRYAGSVTNFIAAGRVAGRYVMSVGDMTAGLSVIILVAGVEVNYQTGYGIGFWGNIVAPIGVVLALTGYCTYRWRETRCLSRGQFLEMRYGSKTFRVVTAFISTSAEMITNAIGPAIAANFFIYYLKLPHEIMICGVPLPCYAIIVGLCLTLALLIIWPAGRISLLITDSIQGILCYPVFVLIVGFVMLKFSWDIDMADVLFDRVPKQSLINPYDVSQLRDFNLFALVVSIFSSFLNRAAWFGNDTSNSGRTPHEQKMAGVLGAWRNGFALVMILVLAIMTIAFMNGGNFAFKGEKNEFNITNNEVRRSLSARVLQKVVPDKALREKTIAAIQQLPDQHRQQPDMNTIPAIDPDKPVWQTITRADGSQYYEFTCPLSQQENLDTLYFDTVRETLGDTPEARQYFQEFRTLFQQMMMPTVLSDLLPAGMMGIFCLLMVMLLISTDDSRIFNSAGTLVQDLILPFYTAIKKERISPKTHLALLRFTTLGVTVFFFIVSLFFRNMDYINMFTTLMCAFWLAGSGPVLVFGLYSRFGNITGAWCSMIFGSGVSLLGLIGQRTWATSIYPWLEIHGYVPACDRVLRAVSAPFEPWIHWQMNAVKFPLNSYEIFFLSMILALLGYIIGSCLTYKPYDLDQLLHRGKYADGLVPERTSWTLRTIFSKLIGITPEYTKGDRVIAWSVFVYTFIYKLLFTFIMVMVCNLFFEWPRSWWNWYFYLTSLVIPSLIGIVTTVWFLWGGIRDLRQLFIDLEKRNEDVNDNGQILSSDKG